ncbi:tail fiber domain-containing protein [Flavobacterium sp.]|uniref:tail fiber domain-containing protein n=2 Tax=Flavobacteriaceae TaxID=49546 RepID=UPI0025F21414|nr:tail fiber domain-containing protein [Flavobacterium sp.]
MSQKIKTSVEIDGSLSASQIPNATVDTDKFLVSDGGVVKHRTGTQLISDLGITLDTATKLQHQVKAGVAINKGQAVYVTDANGTDMVVGLASNSAEATSSKTMGLLDNTVSTNGFANVITEGLLAGLDTSTATIGNPVWLGTNGNLIYGLANKPYAPSHLVFIGIVTRVNSNNGEIFVKVQNGFELDELHDVDLHTTTPINGHLLGYNGTLWVNKTIAGWLGFTPANDSNVVHLTGNETISGNKTFTNVIVGNSGFDSLSSYPVRLYNSGNTQYFNLLTNSSNNLIFNYGGGSTLFSLSAAGNGTFTGTITGNSFYKSGGTSSQFLKADGSVDSNTYALNSGVVHTTGNESISGTKTFNVSTAISAIEIANTGGRALRINNSAGSLYGLLINNDTGVTTSPITIQKNGVNVFLINDAGIASNSNGILVSGTGTTNYIPKFTGANALGNSLIYDNGTNVLLGSTTTLGLGNVNFLVKQTTALDYEGISVLASTNNNFIALAHTGSIARISSNYGNLGSYTPLALTTGGIDRMYITSSGSVGIGTTSPSVKLDVAGDIRNVNSDFLSYNSANNTYSRYGFNSYYPSGGFNITNDGSFPLTFGTNATERMRITSGGNVLIGTTSGTGKMRIDADGSVQDILQLRTLYASTGSRLISFVNSGGSEIGSITQNTGSTVSYNVTSDYRLKEDLKPINGIDLISKINIYDYKWKGYNDRSYGVLAHELQDIVPSVVTGEKDGKNMQQVDYSKLVPILVQAIKELKLEIETLKNK